MKKIEEKDWCFGVVGNIVKTHMSEDGSLLYGTPAFRGGARVYIDGKTGQTLLIVFLLSGLAEGTVIRLQKFPQR